MPKKASLTGSTFHDLGVVVAVVEHLVLVPEDVIVHIVLLRRLRRQDEGLHEAAHGLSVV